MKRKFAAAVGVAVAASLALAGCSAAGDSAGRGARPDPVTITLSGWSLATTPEFKTLADGFHAAAPERHGRAQGVRPGPVRHPGHRRPRRRHRHPTSSPRRTSRRPTLTWTGGQLLDVSDVPKLPDGISGAGVVRGRRQDLRRARTARTRGCCTTTRTCSTQAGSTTRTARGPGTTTRSRGRGPDHRAQGRRLEGRRRVRAHAGSRPCRASQLAQTPGADIARAATYELPQAVLRPGARPAERRRADRLQHGDHANQAHLPGRVRQAARRHDADGHLVRRDPASPSRPRGDADTFNWGIAPAPQFDTSTTGTRQHPGDLRRPDRSRHQRRRSTRPRSTAAKAFLAYAAGRTAPRRSRASASRRRSSDAVVQTLLRASTGAPTDDLSKFAWSHARHQAGEPGVEVTPRRPGHPERPAHGRAVRQQRRSTMRSPRPQDRVKNEVGSTESRSARRGLDDVPGRRRRPRALVPQHSRRAHGNDRHDTDPGATDPATRPPPSRLRLAQHADRLELHPAELHRLRAAHPGAGRWCCSTCRSPTGTCSAKRDWVGLANFQRLVGDGSFRTASVNTALLLGDAHPADPRRRRSASRCCSTTSCAGSRSSARPRSSPTSPRSSRSPMVWNLLFSPEYGPINAVPPVHRDRQPARAGSPRRTGPCRPWSSSSTWRDMGYYMILFLAGPADRPARAHEAARVDGANAWQRFCQRDVPGPAAHDVLRHRDADHQLVQDLRPDPGHDAMAAPASRRWCCPSSSTGRASRRASSATRRRRPSCSSSCASSSRSCSSCRTSGGAADGRRSTLAEPPTHCARSPETSHARRGREPPSPVARVLPAYARLRRARRRAVGLLLPFFWMVIELAQVAQRGLLGADQVVARDVRVAELRRHLDRSPTCRPGSATRCSSSVVVTVPAGAHRLLRRLRVRQDPVPAVATCCSSLYVGTIAVPVAVVHDPAVHPACRTSRLSNTLLVDHRCCRRSARSACS